MLGGTEYVWRVSVCFAFSLPRITSSSQHTLTDNNNNILATLNQTSFRLFYVINTLYTKRQTSFFLVVFLRLFFNSCALNCLIFHITAHLHTDTSLHVITTTITSLCSVQSTLMYKFDLLLMLSHRSVLLLRLPFLPWVITMVRTFSMKSF